MVKSSSDHRQRTHLTTRIQKTDSGKVSVSRFHLLPPPLPLRLFLQQGTESPPASARPATYSHSPEGKERRQHVGGRGGKQEGKEKKY